MNLTAEHMGRGVDDFACMRVHVLKFGYQETVNYKASVHFVSKTSFHFSKKF